MKYAFALIFCCLLIFSCQSEVKKDLPPLTYSGENPRIQNPLSPEESQQHIQLPKGFTAELYASEPNIINPIAMTWDERGRLWVVQSMDYPHGLENEVGGDRITICEDSDGDGKADKFIDFATNQSLTTGIVKVKDGIIVSQAPNMVYLKDDDGDDVMDGKEILFDGFGIWDTHAGPSSLKYGYDNMIWGAVGYSGFENKFNGENVNFSRGVYRFSKDGKEFEPLGQFNNNTWGLGISQDFEVFGSTANNNHACYVGIPMKYYSYLAQKPDWAINADFIQGHYEISPVDTVPLQQVDVRGGYTAAAGANFYLANNYPKEYQNQMYVNEPTGHLVHIAKIVQEGGGFIEVDGGNIFASTDSWTAPVFSETGPDGNLWVADWYNPVIQHNPDARGMDNQIWNDIKGEGNAHLNENRDKRHGRIYIIKHKKAKPSTIESLDPSDDKALMEALLSDNIFWRTTAQRLIVENGKTNLRAALLDLSKKKEKGNLGVAAHALYSLEGLGELNSDDEASMTALNQVLQEGSVASRTAALDLIPNNEVGSEILSKSGLIEQSYLPLRKKVILKASELPETPELYALVEAVMNNGEEKDKWIMAALNVYMKVENRDVLSENEVEIIVPSADETIVSWNYTTEEPAGNWTQEGFDDSKWKKSDGALGTLGLNSSIKTNWEDEEIWIRKSFELESLIEDPVLKILHDDAYKVYVNGQLIAESGGSNRKHELVKLDQGVAKFFKKGKNTVAVYCIDTGGNQAIDVGFGRMKGFQADKVFRVNTVPQKMAFDDKKLHAMAGQKIEIRLNNVDEMPHNMVLIQKGSLQSFGKIVDQFLTDPKAAEAEYVPKSRYILGATQMLDPGESGVIRLTVPNEAGIYPFVCTFPGHWQIMQGELIVSERGSYLSEDPAAPKVAVMGGGGSHDFREFFGVWDGKILSEGGRNITYTEESDKLRDLLVDTDLLMITNNKAFSEETKSAIFNHVNAGKPMLIYHPSTWYNWKDWPEYNRTLVGGGSNSHEKLQEFEVEVVKPNHPLMQGVPKKFRITDELYRWEKDPKGAKINVLAIGRGLESGKEFPVVWTVEHPRAKIVGNTLGHDEDAHGLEAYQTILRNTANWLLPAQGKNKPI
jgi:putative membrane-bound dehydrogenase-like protein